MPAASPSKVLVVGAGIGGLTAAHRLQQAGFAVEVFERESTTSGRVRSIHLDGRVIDTGATVFLSTYRETLDLLRELGLEKNLQPVRGSAVICRDGKRYPVDIDAPLKALFTPALGWRSKLSLIKLLLKLWRCRNQLNFHSLGPARGQDLETLDAYCRRSFPDEVYRYLLNPALKFLYLHNGQSGSLIELLWWLKASGLGKPRSLRGGTSSMTDALAAQLSLHTSTEVTAVRRCGAGVEISTRKADGSTTRHGADFCLLTVPGDIAAQICEDGLSPLQRQFLSSRRYDRSTCVSFVTRRRPALDALMFMVPDDLNADLATIIFAHNIGPQRSRPDEGIVNAYFIRDWSERHLSLSDEALMRSAQSEIGRIVPEVADLVAWNVQRWSHTAAITEVGDCARIADFEAEVDPQSPIQVIGDFQAQASMNVAVSNANRAVRRLIEARARAAR